MEKAVDFYHHVLARELKVQTQNGLTTAVFEHDEHVDIGGSLVLNPNHQAASTSSGPLLYFSVEGRLKEALIEVTKYDGKIVTHLEDISPWGFRAVIIDCCGNRIALHSYKK